MAEEAEQVAVPDRETPEPTGVLPRLLILGLAAVLVLAGLVGWLGFRADQSHDAAVRRDAFLQAARRTAVHLTTIDYEHAQDDVREVLDSATGDFYRRFSERSQELVDSVTRERSQSVGSVSAAGVESQSGDSARVLVVVHVASTHLGGLDVQPRQLRMRLTTQRVGDEVKTSDVRYVT